MTQLLHKIIVLCDAKQAADCKCDQCETLREIAKSCRKALEKWKVAERDAVQLLALVEEEILGK